MLYLYLELNLNIKILLVSDNVTICIFSLLISRLKTLSVSNNVTPVMGTQEFMKAK